MARIAAFDALQRAKQAVKFYTKRVASETANVAKWAGHVTGGGLVQLQFHQAKLAEAEAALSVAQAIVEG